MKRNGLVTARTKSNEKMKYLDIENNYNGLYAVFINNRFASYKIFISEVIKYIGRYVSIYDIKQKLIYMSANVSNIKSMKMELILNYQIAQRDKNERECYILRRRIRQTIGGTYPESLKKKDLKFEMTLIFDLRVILNSEESIEELLKQGKIKNENIVYDIEYMLSGLSKEKYVKLIKKYYGLKSINEEELNQYIEVIRYFCDNLEKNINLLKSYDPDLNKKEISEYKVNGEDKLADSIINNTNLLLKWKITKLNSKLKMYKRLLSSHEKLSNNYEMDSFSKIDNRTRNDIKKDEPFIEEFYTDILEINKVYLEILNKKTIKEEVKEEIKEEFNNQLLLRNNK